MLPGNFEMTLQIDKAMRTPSFLSFPFLIFVFLYLCEFDNLNLPNVIIPNKTERLKVVHVQIPPNTDSTDFLETRKKE